MVLPMVVTSASITTRHLAGAAYLGSSAATSYGLSGQAIFTLVGTACAVVTLIVLIRTGNKKSSREAAEDLEKAYQKGAADRDRELRPWLEYWEDLAKSDRNTHPAPAPPPTPRPRRPKEDDDA